MLGEVGSNDESARREWTLIDDLNSPIDDRSDGLLHLNVSLITSRKRMPVSFTSVPMTNSM
jgi:hypothetical protein